MDVYVATKNAGKLRELETIFGSLGWTLRIFPDYADVAEGADSYEENAALKARALFAQLGEKGIAANVIGDDSGLEVAALGGRPGVLSARYGAPGATWHERRCMLLAEVARSGLDRSAAFVCALHFIAANGKETAVLRRLPGTVAQSERGDAGFSYDPIFLYTPLSATFAELTESQKNEISHRALAARSLVAALGKQAEGTDAQKVGADGT